MTNRGAGLLEDVVDEHRADVEGVVDLRPIARQRQLDGPLQVLIDAKTETYCLGARSTMC